MEKGRWDGSVGRQYCLYRRFDDLLGNSEEDGAAVDILPVTLSHGLGTRLGGEDAVVAVPLQLGEEELVKLVGLHLLPEVKGIYKRRLEEYYHPAAAVPTQSSRLRCSTSRRDACTDASRHPFSHLETDDVGGVVPDLVQDALLAVLPLQRPARAVAVHLPRGELVTQHVVAHDGEDACNTGRVSPHGDGLKAPSAGSAPSPSKHALQRERKCDLHRGRLGRYGRRKLRLSSTSTVRDEKRPTAPVQVPPPGHFQSSCRQGGEGTYMWASLGLAVSAGSRAVAAAAAPSLSTEEKEEMPLDCKTEPSHVTLRSEPSVGAARDAVAKTGNPLSGWRDKEAQASKQ